MAAVGPVWAQSATAGRVLLEPTVSVQETVTDNVGLSSNHKQADSATQGTVGIRASSSSGRVQGTLDYSLTGIVHSSSTGQNEFQNALNAQGKAELLADHLFVDVTGNIAQRAASAFGTQSIDSTSTNSNRTEVSSFGVSPYLQGRLGGFATYEARLNGNWNRSDLASVSDVDSTGASLNLASARAGVFSWSGNLSRQITDYSLGRRSEQDRLRVLLNYSVTPELVFSLIGGREANDLLTTDKQSYNDTGAQLRWSPSPRTKLSGVYERRFFGNSHAVDFTYRTARTAWTFNDSRDISTGTDQSGVLALGSRHDILFSALAIRIPDPVVRETVVQQLLRITGADPNEVLTTGFLASQASVQRSTTLSFALMGLRDTVVFRFLRSQSNSLNKLQILFDDLSTSDVVKQTAWSADFSHRLTPTSNFSVTGLWQRTSGSSSLQSSTLAAVSAIYSIQLGQRSSAAVSVRHSRSGGSSAYDENAVSANFNRQF